MLICIVMIFLGNRMAPNIVPPPSILSYQDGALILESSIAVLRPVHEASDVRKLSSAFWTQGWGFLGPAVAA